MEKFLCDTAIGIAFCGAEEQLLQGDSLAQYLQEATHKEMFLERIKELNGSWCYVSASPQADHTEQWAAVDPYSSRALYYRVTSEGLRVSDDGYKLLYSPQEAIKPAEREILFFSQWGFLPDDKTLHPEIKRIPPGCMISYSPRSREVTTLRYTELPYDSAPLSCSYQEAKELFMATLDRAMERMVRAIGDRPVVLPLSAGRDSRLIATYLKKSGITPAFCCSYGKDPQHFEVKRARLIAERLGFDHRYFPTIPPEYDASSYTQDADALAYLRYISGLGSGYFFAEYVTAQHIAQELPNAVVLPGHNGDMLGGCEAKNYLPSGPNSRRTAAYIIALHERGNRLLSHKELNTLVEIHEEILNSYPSTLQGTALLECFSARGRGAKYYINSSRGFRYYGLDTWMPFLDKELCSLAYRLPAEYRIGKRLYEDVTTTLFQELSISFVEDSQCYKEWSKPAYRIKTRLRPLFAYKLAQKKRPLFNRKGFVGFDKMMEGDLLQQVQQNVPWQPTSSNGISFAWWLLYNGCLDA